MYIFSGHGLECFLCSYSPRGNSSRVDGCTDANFTEDLTETRTCAIGCESVSVYDLNGKMLVVIISLSNRFIYSCTACLAAALPVPLLYVECYRKKKSGPRSEMVLISFHRHSADLEFSIVH